MGTEFLFEFNKANFDKEALAAELPVLIDFWAPWCGPCKMLTPIITDLSKDFQGKVKIGKCNIDENPSIAATYGVSSIPTILFFKGGVVKEKQVGLLAKEPLRKKINAFLKA
jgi:thioredoxin 1